MKKDQCGRSWLGLCVLTALLVVVGSAGGSEEQGVGLCEVDENGEVEPTCCVRTVSLPPPRVFEAWEVRTLLEEEELDSVEELVALDERYYVVDGVLYWRQDLGNVNFHRDLGFNWILLPESMGLTYAGGVCPSTSGGELGTPRLYEVANRLPESHAGHDEVPLPQCVPVEFEDLEVLVRRGGGLVIEVIRDLIVTKAGCR